MSLLFYMQKDHEKVSFLNDQKIVFKDNFVPFQCFGANGFDPAQNDISFFANYFDPNKKPEKEKRYPISEPKSAQTSSSPSSRTRIRKSKLSQDPINQTLENYSENNDIDNEEINITSNKTQLHKLHQNAENLEQFSASNQQSFDPNENISKNANDKPHTQRKILRRVKKKRIPELDPQQLEENIPKPSFPDLIQENESNPIHTKGHNKKKEFIEENDQKPEKNLGNNEQEELIEEENQNIEKNLENNEKEELIEEKDQKTEKNLENNDKEKEEESEPSFSMTYKAIHQNPSNSNSSSPSQGLNVIEHKPWSPERKSMTPSVFVVPKKGSPVKEVIIHDIGEEKPIPKKPEPLQQVKITQENIKEHVSEGTTALFSLKLYPNKKNIEKYQFIDELTGNEIMFATKTSSVGSAGFNIFLTSYPSQPIAILTSNFTRSTFFATCDFLNTKMEICDIEFKSGFMGKAPNKQFTVYLPKEGEILKAKDSANLIKQQNQVNIYVPKPPKMKGGFLVLRFGGRVKMESIKNFILVPPDDHENHIFVFGKVKEDIFAGDIMHPFTPLQAFCVSLSHFK